MGHFLVTRTRNADRFDFRPLPTLREICSVPLCLDDGMMDHSALEDRQSGDSVTQSLSLLLTVCSLF
jgi:hypothetical protein